MQVARTNNGNEKLVQLDALEIAKYRSELAKKKEKEGGGECQGVREGTAPTNREKSSKKAPS